MNCLVSMRKLLFYLQTVKNLKCSTLKEIYLIDRVMTCRNFNRVLNNCSVLNEESQLYIYYIFA